MAKEYTLKHPINWGEHETITKLTIRRPVAGDFRGIEMRKNVEFSFDDLMTLASRTTATEKAKLEKLDIDDMQEVYAIISNFINPSQPTGTPPSDCLPDPRSTSTLTE